MVKVLPLGLTYYAGIIGGMLLHLISRQKREIMAQELSLVLPEKSTTEITRIVKKSFINYVLSEMEVLLYPGMNEIYINKNVVIEGMEHLDNAISKGKGVLLFQAHFGAFQMTMPSIGYSGYKMSQISASASTWKDAASSEIQKKSFDIKAGYEYTLPVKHIAINTSLRPVFRALENKEIVGITVDGGGGNKIVPINFLGRTAYFQQGGADIALRTGASIVPAFIVTEKGLRHRLIIKPPISLPETALREDKIRLVMAEFAKMLEELVYLHPDHYGYSLYLRRDRASLDPYPFFEDHKGTKDKSMKKRALIVAVMIATGIFIRPGHCFNPEKGSLDSKVDMEVAKAKDKWVKKGKDKKDEYELTVTSIRWGTGEDELPLEDNSAEYDGPPPGTYYDSPRFFTIDRDGNYCISAAPVYGTAAEGTIVPLKVFNKDGKLLRIINLKHPHPSGASAIIKFDSEGNIVADGYPGPFVVKYDKDGKVLKSFLNESWLNMQDFRLFPSGKFEVEDIIDNDQGHGVRTRLFDKDGNLIRLTWQGYVDNNLFYNEDYQGREYRVVRVGGKQIQIQRVVDGKVDLNLNYMQDVNQDMWKILGFDKKGLMYILREYQPEGKTYKDMVYLVERFDPDTGEVDYIEIKGRRFLTGTGSNNYVQIDDKGNIYQYETSLENFKIWKWSKKSFK